MGITVSRIPLPFYEVSVSYAGVVQRPDPHKLWATMGDLKLWLLGQFWENLVAAGFNNVGVPGKWSVTVLVPKADVEGSEGAYISVVVPEVAAFAAAFKKYSVPAVPAGLQLLVALMQQGVDGWETAVCTVKCSKRSRLYLETYCPEA
jgi:hypothetical protein